MRNTVAALAFVSLLAAGLAWADALQQPVSLRYKPVIGETQTSAIVAKLTDLQMNGMSLGINGQVEGTVKLTVTKVDAETGNCTVRGEFEMSKAEFAGQPREPKPVAPAEVTYSPLGEIVRIKRADPPADTGLGALTTGGLPLDGIALMAMTVGLPEDAVAPSAEWKQQGEQDLPILGKARLETTTKLLKIDGPRATLESQSHADVPAFEMENPLLEGTMKVEGAKFALEKVQRQFDVSRSVVTHAKGGLKIELTADMGLGAPTPIAAIGEFQLAPKKQPQTDAEQAEGGEADQQGQPPADQTDGGQPAPEVPGEQASGPGVTLGPLAASASYREGTVTLALGADGARATLPGSLSRYKPYLSAARASCAVSAGISGPGAGNLALSGKLQAGPVALDRTVEVNIRDLVLAVSASVGRLLRQQAATQ